MVNGVAIVVCAWPPYTGGISQNAHGQAECLAKRGYAVSVFTPDYGQSKLTAIDYCLVYLKAPIHFGLGALLPQLLWRLWDFDLVHLYYPFYGAVQAIWWLKILRGKKIKLVVHHEMEAVGRGWKKVFFKLHAAIFLPLIICAADKVIVLSADYAQHCELSLYWQKYRAKFVAIGNGVDANKFKPQAKDLALMQQLGLSPSEQVILFVGGLDKQHYFKGVEVLLSAFTQLNTSKSKLLIIGEGNLKSKYQQQAQALGVLDKVIFVGRVDNDNLPRYYNLADVFVLPSVAKTESFSTATAEAQSCGLPAVISDLPGIRQTIINGQTGLLFKVGGSQELAQKVERLLGDENLRRQMSAAAVRHASENYGWEKVIGQIIAVYQSL